MVQKEVAHRIAGKLGTKDYGYLSIFCSYYSDIQILFDVSNRCFMPQPKVISSVVKFTNKFSPAPNPSFFDLIKHCFTMRRKTILNCLTNFKGLSKYQCLDILSASSISLQIRPDKLKVEDWQNLIENINL
jgi:16S rRNA (adenine1518-N6/adenine1519-N6)-dimethyltransferase